jgi:transcriptional antiterminator RfaH
LEIGGGVPRMRQWYVIRAKPRREALAASSLSSSGIDVYLPTIKSRLRSGTTVINEPLFPGYFFGRLDPWQGELTLANHTFNVLYVLGNGDEALPVSEELIASIRRGLEHGTGRSPIARFRSGDSVIINHGPFKGIEAVFDGYLSAAGRVRVLINTLQSAYRAELGEDQLSAVNQSATRVAS